MIVRIVLALLSGALFAFAFPGYSQGWLAFVALAPLVVASVRARHGREAFLLGWLSQTFAWLLMVPWVIRVMTHYGGLSQGAGVLLLVGMALILGSYGAVFAFVVRRLQLGQPFLPWLVVPAAWAALEYARTYLLSGYPWNLLAASIVDERTLIQIDRFAGPYLVGAMLVLFSATLAWLVTQKTPPIAKVMVLGMHGILLLVWWGTGLVASRLVLRPNTEDVVTAALLQPNIAQQVRWDPANVTPLFQRMLDMTAEAKSRGAQIVIWPESTVPLSYSETPFFRDTIEHLSQELDIDIILGSVATAPDDPSKIWNAAFLASEGKTVGHYDKVRLVPFGEYVPMRRVLFFAEKMVRAVGEFQFGTSVTPLQGRLRYGLAICYEIVFPQIARTQIRNGATVLVTITNDAWFEGSAPTQHLWQARLRAIEGDRYVLRAATTGISALIDPSGQIISSLPMDSQGIIYAKFQPRSTTTPYVKYGDWFAWLSIVVVLIALIRRRSAAGVAIQRESPGKP